MFKIIRALALFSLLVIAACSPTPTLTEKAPILPTDEFSHFDEFGDGYSAKVKVSEVKDVSSEKIVTILVEQWLQHYKTESTYQDASVKDFSVDSINLLTKPDNSIYTIVAGVKFSIIPSKTPNDYASFPGDLIDGLSDWWHLSAPFGVLQNDDYYYLRLVFGWGT